MAIAGVGKYAISRITIKLIELIPLGRIASARHSFLAIIILRDSLWIAH